MSRAEQIDRALPTPGAGIRHEQDKRAFCDAMRQVPGPVAIIATQHLGLRRGLAATAWTSLSADPPTLLACVNKSASAHPFMLDAGAFSVNLLDRSHAEVVSIFSAQRGLDGDERFVDDAWDDGPMGQPMFRQAVTSFECELVTSYEHGTHSVFVGRVGEIRTNGTGRALLYLDGGYADAVPWSGVAR